MPEYPPSTVLVCDDDADYRSLITRYLQAAGHCVVEAADGAQGLEILQRQRVGAVLTDLQMPRADGLAVLRLASACAPPVPVLVMTGYATVETAVEAMKLGALDYVTKPVDRDELLVGVQQALERGRMLGAAGDADPGEGFGGLLGASAAMQEVFDQIRRVAPFKSTVLITGESGTGKELVSRAIHALSPCGSGPFVAVNCAALPRELVESQLFGHEKGSFTGAQAQHQGFFEAAHGGTLFLDEVGDLPSEAQTKMLRALEDRQVTRLGSTRPIAVDVRLVAATNVDLEEAVQRGRFREDLFYRLDVLRIDLPPLRQRRDDIPMLVRVFLDHFARDNGVPPRDIHPEALARLRAHSWPGNVRELKNIAERLAVMAREATIQVEDLPAELRGPPAAPAGADSLDMLDGMSLEAIEEAIIKRTLEQMDGNRTHAARALGISLRTLQRKLKEYGWGEGGEEGAT